MPELIGIVFGRGIPAPTWIIYYTSYSCSTAKWSFHITDCRKAVAVEVYAIKCTPSERKTLTFF
ncbi:hypothetical protein AMJ80_09915 [bacterium SM23_31]|nr:MAG: hypothetical protein AMJ80_09915 [bacterium SM23_31]